MHRIGDCDSAWSYWRGDTRESLQEREGGHTQSTWIGATTRKCKKMYSLNPGVPEAYKN